MPFEHIEKLKSDYTDKYVVVDASRPELARFRDATGQVKTVNMSGRALVEFNQYDNIGWYDIELDFLKVVPKPEPKAAEEKPAPAKKPAAESAAAKAAPPAKPSGKPSTADILAAARAKAGAPAAKPAAAAPAAPEKTEQPVVKAAPVEKPAKPVAKAVKPSAGPLPTTTAEKIAYCRRVDSNA